ncbi:hypothetical protein [Streptomyces sp. NPDC101165]|uniref:hypothetical protein n=1 Tax=Streptomyces sp. NPDC101165 TaxID=3366119 RepID=UPI00382DC3FC
MTLPSPPGPDRSPATALLILAAILLAPLVYGLYWLGHDVMECTSPTGCRGNHDEKVTLVNAALVLFGAPLGGAALTGFAGALLGRRSGVWAAGGVLLGTLATWAATVVWLYISLQKTSFDF